MAIAAAAPPELRERSERIFSGPRGLEVVLSEGPRLIFGGRADARAKWAAAARVLAEPSAQGATYLDLRVRGRVRPAAWGPIDPAEEEAEDGAAAGRAEPSAIGLESVHSQLVIESLPFCKALADVRSN